MTDKKIELVIADDHQLFRQGLKSLLEMEEKVKIVGEAKTGNEAVKLVNEKDPDVVLMDIKMPQLNGIEATRKIKEDHPDVHVLMLTVFDDESHILNAIQAGASGYFLKARPISELTGVIEKAYEGKIDLSAKVTTGLIRGFQKNKLSAMENYNLTKRELDVLKIVVLGKTNKEISEELHIAVQTVKNYLSSMYRKFDVDNRTQLVHKAAESGIIDAVDNV
ncbi:MAG: response regulator [Elusimicrobiota bacterium]